MDTPSPALNKLLAKLAKDKAVPKVNLPALARRDVGFMECWEADPGKVFVSSDFTSLEPSLTAHFSKDINYNYATFAGIGKEPYINEHGVLMIDDIYLMVASQMPGLKEPVIEFFSDPINCAKWVEDSDACKNHKLIKGPRKKAKPACLGFNYGMRAKRFVKQCYDAGIPMDIGKANLMYQAYWNLFPGIRNLTKSLEVICKKQGVIVNPFGYRLTPEPHKSYNAFIQSSASGVVDVMVMKFFEQLPEAEFVVLVHDEFIYQIEDKHLKKAREVTDRCIESLNNDLGWDVPMRIDFTVARNFAEIK